MFINGAANVGVFANAFVIGELKGIYIYSLRVNRLLFARVQSYFPVVYSVVFSPRSQMKGKGENKFHFGYD